MSAIVMTLGWWRSKPKALAKYTALYERHAKIGASCTDTLSTPELSFMSQRQKAVDRALARLREQCEAQVAKNGPSAGKPRVVVHAMSNNGALELASMLKTLEKEPEAAWKPEIRGIVIDSAPGNLTLRAWSGALLASSSNKPALGLGVGAAALGAWLGLYTLFGPLGSLLALGAGLVAGRQGEKRLTENYHQRLMDVTAGIPKLFLYSDGDDLVVFDALESAAKRMQDRGDNIRMHRFDKSSHVAHMLTFREDYEKVVNAFLDKVL